jgi:RNA polymerase sigma-70 factor, ECF subfamily
MFEHQSVKPAKPPVQTDDGAEDPLSTQFLTTQSTTPQPLVQPKLRAAVSLADDQALIAACRRGENRAMELLYHQHKRRVFSITARIAGNTDAEEVVQETFVRVFRALPAFRGDSMLSTWIYRLAVNCALTYVTKRGRRREVSDEALATIEAPQGVSRDLALAARMESALASLPAGYRAILVLHDVEGLSHEECAEILRCRVGTCKSQLHKARGKMRDLLSSMSVEGT